MFKIEEAKCDPNNRQHYLRDKQYENIHHLVGVGRDFVFSHSELPLQNAAFYQLSGQIKTCI